jgi:hypothetical protein
MSFTVFISLLLHITSDDVSSESSENTRSEQLVTIKLRGVSDKRKYACGLLALYI